MLQKKLREEVEKLREEKERLDVDLVTLKEELTSQRQELTNGVEDWKAKACYCREVLWIIAKCLVVIHKVFAANLWVAIDLGNVISCHQITQRGQIMLCP